MHPRQAIARHGRDLAAAVLVAAFTVALALAPAGPPLTAAQIVAIVVACGALLLRRRWPAAAFVVSAVAAEMFLAMRSTHEAAVLLAAPLLALYTVAQSVRRRGPLLVAAAAVVALAVVHLVVRPASMVGAGTLALVAFGALAVAAGAAARNRAAYLAEVEARARRAEADRDAEAARRVTEERLRLARELHDVLGHQLAVITIQSAVAARTLGEAPDLAREALGHVRVAGAAALDELRDTIGLLRAPHEPATPVEPSAGTDRLPALYASMRRSGLAITHEVEGTPYPLPAAIDLTAYRIVQESLTNVCRHAGPVAAVVSFGYAPSGVTVAVSNDPPAVPVTVAGDGQAGAAGHGLVGMRERLAALGGNLTYGAVTGGGFRVTAWLPAEPRVIAG